MKNLFHYLLACLFGISTVYAQTPFSKKLYIKGIADPNAELTLILQSKLLAAPATMSIATDEQETEFLFSYDIYGYGEYTIKLNDGEIYFYAEPNDTIQVNCKNSQLSYVKGSNFNGETYRQIREMFPSYAVQVTGQPGPEVFKIAASLEEDRPKREAKLEALIKEHNLSDSYINFERNQSYYTAAMLNMIYQAYVKPKYFDYNEETKRVSMNSNGTKKIIKKIAPMYPLKSPYPEAIHSNQYHNYLMYMYLFSSFGPSILPIPDGDATQAMKDLTQEYYDNEGAQIAVYNKLFYSKYNMNVYETLHKELHTAIVHPLLKAKLQVAHQNMMEKKAQDNELTKALPKPLFVLDNLSKKSDFDEYFSQFDGKTVYLDIWATWCKGCIAQFDAGKLLQHKIIEEGYGDKVAFVYFCAKIEDDMLDHWKQTVDKFKLSGTHIRKSTYLTFNLDFKVAGYPTYAIRKPDGTWVLAEGPRGNAYEQVVEAVESAKP